MTLFEASQTGSLTQALSHAISLGLISTIQAKRLAAQHSEEEVLLLLEQIASEQMESGHQCIGDQCML